MDKLDNLTRPYFKTFNNSTYAGIVKIAYIILGGTIAANIPKEYLTIFNCTSVKLLGLFTVALMASRDPSIALTVGIALILMTVVAQRRQDNDNTVQTFVQQRNNPPMVSIGCVTVTQKDLMDAFDNSEQDLRKAMFQSRVPQFVGLNEENAPIIATYLINFGFDLKRQSKYCTFFPDVFM